MDQYDEPLGGYQNISDEELMQNTQAQSPQQQANQNPQNPEPERKKMSMTKVGLIVVGVLVALILGLTLLSRFSVKKENEGNDTQNVQQQESGGRTPYEEAQNVLETQSENLANNAQNQEANTSSSQNPTPAENNVPEKEIGTLDVQQAEQPVQQGTIPGDTGTLSETLQEPALGEVKQASVIVSNKSIYTIDGTAYSYSLSLLMLSENQGEEYTTIRYFCSRKTFDNVEKGDNLIMQYQVDPSGLISPSGISK